MIIRELNGNCLDLDDDGWHIFLTEAKQRELIQWFAQHKIALMADVCEGVLAECRAREDEYKNYCDNKIEG